MPNHYDVRLRLEGENAVSDPIPDLAVWDTVQYFSGDGEVSIEFPDKSPFPESLIGNRQTVTARNVGHFRGNCSIVKDGKKFGWKRDPSPSGVDHTVKPPVVTDA